MIRLLFDRLELAIHSPFTIDQILCSLILKNLEQLELDEVHIVDLMAEIIMHWLEIGLDWIQIGDW